jgi:hypothetical protein
MNEDFMKQFIKSPAPDLVKKIQSRLEKKERAQIIKQYATRSVFVLIFAFGMLMAFSSTVRAYVLQTVEHVQVLIVCRWDLNIYCEGDGVLSINPSEYLSLDDAQAHITSSIVLPTYVPQGFERRADVEFFDLPNQPVLVVTWNRKNHYSLIKLLISHHSIELETYARTLGEGAIEGTLLNGKPAIVVRGTWNIGVQENDFMMTALVWRYDENTVYALMSLEGAVPLDELIKMAQSIP